MTSRGYKARITASKANLDESLKSLASENVGIDADAFVALARERLNCPVTPEYAESLVQDAAASAGRGPGR